MAVSFLGRVVIDLCGNEDKREMDVEEDKSENEEMIPEVSYEEDEDSSDPEWVPLQLSVVSRVKRERNSIPEDIPEEDDEQQPKHKRRRVAACRIRGGCGKSLKDCRKRPCAPRKTLIRLERIRRDPPFALVARERTRRLNVIEFLKMMGELKGQRSLHNDVSFAIEEAKRMPVRNWIKSIPIPLRECLMTFDNEVFQNFMFSYFVDPNFNVRTSFYDMDRLAAPKLQRIRRRFLARRGDEYYHAKVQASREVGRRSRAGRFLLTVRTLVTGHPIRLLVRCRAHDCRMHPRVEVWFRLLTWKSRRVFVLKFDRHLTNLVDACPHLVHQIEKKPCMLFKWKAKAGDYFACFEMDGKHMYYWAHELSPNIPDMICRKPYAVFQPLFLNQERARAFYMAQLPRNECPAHQLWKTEGEHAMGEPHLADEICSFLTLDRSSGDWDGIVKKKDECTFNFD